MEEKNYMYITDNKGINQKMEIILALNSLDGTSQFIAYKQVNKSVPIYMAKIYTFNNKITLNTNLTYEEKQLLISKIKSKIING